uniref:molybdopterin adenylyltransferase n=1 Tax=Phlebotomus papatasi TaxID=29031 RepID=A0A1B0D7M9_PHLPP
MLTLDSPEVQRTSSPQTPCRLNVDFPIDACFKINTGAPLPHYADAVVQVEDTKLLEMDGDQEVFIEILTIPEKNTDIRQIGSDIAKGDVLFSNTPPLCAGKLALAASIGTSLPQETPIKIAIVSTGDEIVQTGEELKDGQIYDSNTPMLKKLLEDFGFHVNCTEIARDTFDGLKETLERMFEQNSFVICSGGVSMGDRDFVKSVLKEMQMDILFGLVRKDFNGLILSLVADRKTCSWIKSPVNLPPFRASIKDGYAVKSSGGGGKKRVLGSVSAGNPTDDKYN